MEKKMKNTKLYYEFEFDRPIIDLSKSFIIEQKEIKLKKEMGSKSSFEIIDVIYKCRWKEQNFNPNKPTLIIPTKNMSKLLNKTINNLKENKVLEQCNVIIVDDMSEEDIESIAKECCYLRVENNKGFNFSMLNNIPSLIVQQKGGKEVIFWNNDLYAKDSSTLDILLQRHRDNNSSLSGTKLLYPPIEISYIKEEDSENIKEFYKHVKGKWRETIQYAGQFFLPTMPKTQSLTPHHYMRFCDPKDPRVNCDKGVSCLTGALMVVKLQDFIDVGGFNPSLSKNFQDTDLCLKIIKNNKHCYYFGKDIHFYHDESVSLAGKKIGDKQLRSDEVLFGKIWNQEIWSLVL
jgi:GT2 family glycosyltransferase